MTDRKAPPEEIEALNASRNEPEEPAMTRRQALADAAQRPDAQHARLGAELARDGGPGSGSETEDAMKRATGGERKR
ncbi:hypothetical protein ACUN0C_14015 [Faunimonas sp. B44]|uniref:hypothetical protein n=1 Tax=Faunimonas sp. B44 TaxID=3461493 RepID=UPI004044D09C